MQNWKLKFGKLNFFYRHIHSTNELLNRKSFISKLFLSLKIGSAFLAIVLLFTVLYIFIIFLLPSIQDQGYRFIPISNDLIGDDTIAAMINQSNNEREFLLLQKRLDQFKPVSSYLIVNTTENKFKLFSRKMLIREGICSTGSYTQLISGDNREWLFQTPKGVFRIRDKKKYPVWKKPDWAFIEDGLPVPSPNHSSRFEYGTLGDYSLSLGDGYMIHGTLYKRFLGMPVTHGCIRLGDDDLKAVYVNMPIGSKVYIF